jgi:hypothetical protein
MTAPDLQAQMEAAAAALDFEEAARLRNLMALARQTDADPSDTDASGLKRQQPGAMGIGSSQPVPVRPDGWIKPKKPDPMTRNRSR